MAKGYAEGPAAEEAERRRDELERGVRSRDQELRLAVYGSTEDEPEPHFIGWRDDVRSLTSCSSPAGLGPERRARQRRRRFRPRPRAG